MAENMEEGKTHAPLQGARIPHQGPAPRHRSLHSPLHRSGVMSYSTVSVGLGMTGVAAQFCSGIGTTKGQTEGHYEDGGDGEQVTGLGKATRHS